MAKKATSKKKQSKLPEYKEQIKSFFSNRQTQTILGAFLVFSAFFLVAAFISFFFSWQQDQSTLSEFYSKVIHPENILGKVGASLSHFFIYNGFGLAAFIIPSLLFISGSCLLLKSNFKNMIVYWNWGLFNMILISVALGFVDKKNAILSGIVGYEINDYLKTFIGATGLAILLFFLAVCYVIIRFKITPEKVTEYIQKRKDIIASNEESVTEPEIEENIVTAETAVTKTKVAQQEQKNEAPKEVEETPATAVKEEITLKKEVETKPNFELSVENLQPTIDNHSSITDKKPAANNLSFEVKTAPDVTLSDDSNEELEIAVEKIEEEKSVSENLSDKILEDFGEFDPTLELGHFKFPTFNLLKQYNETISVDPAELEANKDRIVETLKNYKIGIDKIKATVGPTITLYEIVPEAGVRISKIKNLEDDIALSLSALGIRIIAPIPGKGTIGIEVPNRKASIVSMHSVIASKKFQESPMELPIAFGKTISNETFVVDLAKMPHLLMAGATGQGKSVGLNAILTSLLYKKHPAEVKFVLVDPKKVELTLFNKIERHYLAKLPGEDEAIITDTTKVVHTLNSLCIEMDNRYDILKKAMVRNIKEYNAKFKARKLNPENGHQFLPYIVLVIDEFADLIMTAGKEVETPIARLAQLARAIGIHLIVATQRPSVNVITGIIKANFPARVAFRVTSKIDSRTILDAPGADQLIGRGDMLFTNGNDLTRIQCAFVDTPEVEKITDYIGSQKAYPDAHLLPEYVGEEAASALDVDIKDRDKLFKDAAEVIVTAQQGSASLLQRKLKLGYNRAGRIIDQLEAAGIVGPFEGSKARQVLVPDFIALEQLLENEKNH